MTFTDPIVTNISLGPWMLNLDDATGGWFGFLFLVSVVVVLFISFKAFTPAKAMAVSGTFSLIIGLFLLKMGVVGHIEIGLVAIFTAIGVVGVYIESKRGY